MSERGLSDEPVALEVSKVYWEGDKLMAMPKTRPPQREWVNDLKPGKFDGFPEDGNLDDALEGSFSAEPTTKEPNELQEKALAIVMASMKVSVSEVQRKLRIGYNAAQTLCQSLVDDGFVDGLMLSPNLTNPQQREWVGLSDEEMKAIEDQNKYGYLMRTYRAIEQALKEKNHG